MNLLEYIKSHPGQSTGVLAVEMSKRGAVSFSDVRDELQRMAVEGLIYSVRIPHETWYAMPDKGAA